MRTIQLLTFIILLTGCVSSSSYDNLENELRETHQQNDTKIEELSKQIQGLNAKVNQQEVEIEDLMFNKDSMLVEIQELYDIEEFTLVKSKVAVLSKKYPNAVESKKALQLLPIVYEKEAWKSIEDSPSIYKVDNFINNYEKSSHLKKAKLILSNLKLEKMNDDFESLKDNLTISSVKSFILNYPDHSKVDLLEDLIIELEIESILNDTKTGTLPSFEKDYYGNHTSSYSSVTITNSTNYTLIVRYGGPSILKIEIPANGNKSINVENGSYKITASANGMNYAGSENLYGNYTTEYYITTSTSRY